MTPEQLAGLNETERPPGAIVADQPIDPHLAAANAAKSGGHSDKTAKGDTKTPAATPASTATVAAEQPNWIIWAVLGACAVGLSYFLLRKKGPDPKAK
jgi:hypothetical protein